MANMEWRSPVPAPPRRTVIVTGGSRGIGRGIARQFARAGYNVLVVSRHLSEALAAAAEMGQSASAFEADVSQPLACTSMAKAALERYGSIDVLVVNAGIFPSTALEAMTASEFGHVIDVNLKGTFLSVSACVPQMKAQGWGRVVLISSITGPITGFPGWSHYAASKAGQLGFMRTAAIELAPYGVTVNAVLPGNIVTEGLDALGDEYQSRMAASIPLKRLGTVQDVAHAVFFFASDGASYITGQTLVVDGGQVLPE